MANPQRRTLAAMIATLRYNLDDGSSQPRWSTALLTDNLNHAKDYVWNEVRKEREDYFLSTLKSTDGSVTILGETYATSALAITASTTLDLTLPPDFAELRTFRAITSGYEWVPFRLRTVTDVDYRAARLYPDAVTPYEFWGAITNERTLSLAPKSDTALDTELVYIWQPADMTTGDSMQMPYPLFAAVEAYATATAFVQDDDPKGAVWEQRAAKIIGNVVGANVRQSSDPIIVESAGMGL